MKRRPYALRLVRPGFRGDRMPSATVGQSIRRLVLLGGASAAVAVLLFVVTVLTPAGQRVGDLVLYGRPRGDQAVAQFAADTLATIDVVLIAVATVALGAAALVRSGVALATVVVASIVCANLTTQALETVLARPSLVGDAAYATGNSFPSGHVTIVASLCLAAVLAVPRLLRGPTALIGAGLVALVGMSTVAAGWHRLADVAGAVLIALAWTSLLAAALAARQGRMPRRSWAIGSGRWVASWGRRFGTVALLVGGIGIAATWIQVTSVRGLADALAVAPQAFAAAILVVLGTALAASAGLLWALRGVAFEPGA